MKSLVIITGPTGIGKTKLSIDIANSLSTDIVSCDSRQIYKELYIGTAVPSLEELTAAKHHLIQHVSIHDYYNVSRYEHEALSCIEEIHKTKDVAVVTGGTGLYIDAICKGIDIMPDPDPEIRAFYNKLYQEHGLSALQEELLKYDPEYYRKVDLNNYARIIRALEMCKQTGKTFTSYRKTKPKERPFKCIKIALDMDRDILYNRINLRVDQMVEAGLVEEARSVFEHKGLSALKTVGYKELFEAFENKLSIEEGIEHIKNNSRKYARKQLSWIRRDKVYKWFEPSMKDEILSFVKASL
jgi:tRNA dimethylallyltransferase